ncbi:hypothetical protein WG622_02530 [Cognatishimia sp. D5M38]|uniref:Uncharacterized protein n=1 Tax=Cognatishimia coralii TaxID=3083254 RepID=A0ABU8QCH0_9RHOB
MIKSILISKILGSAFRHILGAGGAFVVGNGLADAATVETAIGCAMTLGSFGLSVGEKYLKAS